MLFVLLFFLSVHLFNGFCAFSFAVVTLTDWKKDLKLGGSIIWASLGIGNILTVIICIFYLVQKVNWGTAAKKSTMAMQRIEKLSSMDLQGSEFNQKLLDDV